MNEPTSEDRHRAATAQVEAVRRRPVRFSNQAASALTTTVLGVLGGGLAGLGGRWWVVAVVVLGVVLSLAGWLTARRRDRLQPFFPSTWSTLLGPLQPGEQRSAHRVINGRAVPSSPAQRELVRAVLGLQRASVRDLGLSLVGLVVTLLGLAVATTRTWLIVMAVVAGLLFAAVFVMERLLARRVERKLAQQGD